MTKTLRAAASLAIPLLLGIAVVPASASTSMKFGGATATVSTDTPVVSEATRTIEQTVTIVTGKKPAQLAIDFSGIPYARRINGRSFIEGLPIRFMGIAAIEGSAELTGGGGGIRGDQRECSTSYQGPLTGYERWFNSVFLRVRPRAQAAITARFAVAGDAPWINTNYAPEVRVHRSPVFDPRDAQEADRRFDQPGKRGTILMTPRPLITRPLAARTDIRFKTNGPFSRWETPSYRLGETLVIRGEVIPNRGELPLILRLNGKVRATAVTDSSGQFAIPHRFTSRGAQLLSVEYPGAEPDALLPDRGCPVEVTVRGTK